MVIRRALVLFGLLVTCFYSAALSHEPPAAELCGLASASTANRSATDKASVKADALLATESWVRKIADVAQIDHELIAVAGDLSGYAVAGVGWSEALKKWVIRVHAPDLDYLKATHMSDWPVVGAIAHELGHVADFIRAETKDVPKDRRKWELNADYFAGRMLKRLKCPYDALQYALHCYNVADTEYPSTVTRIAAMTEGWRAEAALHPSPAATQVTMARSIWLTASCQITWKAKSPTRQWPRYLIVNGRIRLIDCDGRAMLETDRTSKAGWMDFSVRCQLKDYSSRTDWKPEMGGDSIDIGKLRSEMEYVAEIPAIDLRKADSLGTFLPPDRVFFASGDLAKFGSVNIWFPQTDKSGRYTVSGAKPEGNLMLTLQLHNEPDEAEKRPILMRQENYVRTWDVHKDGDGYKFSFSNFLSSPDFRAAVGL